MIEPELKAQWVAALRSGAYRQAKGVLLDPDTGGMCCLGVLAVVAGHGDELLKDASNDELMNVCGLERYDEGNFGMTWNRCNYLAWLNDRTVSTFTDVATAIEANKEI